MSNPKEIAKAVMEAKVVNFEALGKTVAQLGPQLASQADQWANCCGTLRSVIRIFRLPPFGPRIPELDRLERLEGLDKQL